VRLITRAFTSRCAKFGARDANAARLTVAEQKLLKACAKVESAALEADEAALDKTLAHKRAADDKLGALKAAPASQIAIGQRTMQAPDDD
jgi:hypothetical protein